MFGFPTGDLHPVYSAPMPGTHKYVKGQARTCGMESFRALLERGFYGVYHRVGAKPLRDMSENLPGGTTTATEDTTDQRSAMVSGMRGKMRLTWFDSQTFLYGCSLVST